MKATSSAYWLSILVYGVTACVLGPYSLNGISAALLVVLVAGALLPPSCGFLSVAAYLAAGLFLPVYANHASGLGTLLGSYGGYLFALLLCPLAISFFVRYLKKDYLLSVLIGFGAAMLLYFAFGMVWYTVSTGKNIAAVMQSQVTPCILVLMDALAAFLISARLHKGKR